MPEIVACPECSRKLRVPDEMIGKKVKCPGCTKVFAASKGNGAPAPVPTKKTSPRPPVDEDRIEDKPRAASRRAATPPPEEEEEERPRGRRAKEEPEEDEDYARRRRDEEEEEPEEEDDRPRRRGGNKREGWEKVSRGLMLIIISIVVAIGGGILVGIINGVMQAGAVGTFNPRNPGRVAVGLGATFFIALMLQKLLQYSVAGLNLTGHFFDMSAPANKGINPRGLAVTTFSLFAVQVGCALLADMVGFFILGAAGLMGGGMNPMGGMAAASGGLIALAGISLIGGLCYLGGMICFIFLLRSICLSLGNHGLAKQIMTFFISFISAIGATILVFIIMAVVMGAAVFSMIGAANNPQGANAGAQAMGATAGIGLIVAMGLGCILALVFLGLGIWYIVILFQVRGAVNNRLSR